MSYYLEDPYRYLPKCFPFLDKNKPYSRQYSSHRITQKNRDIESDLVQRKQEYLAQINEENKNSEINMLRVRALAQSLKKPSNQEIQDFKSEIYGTRRNKENNLRRMSHKFPDFVQNQHLLNRAQ